MLTECCAEDCDGSPDDYETDDSVPFVLFGFRILFHSRELKPRCNKVNKEACANDQKANKEIGQCAEV